MKFLKEIKILILIIIIILFKVSTKYFKFVIKLVPVLKNKLFIKYNVPLCLKLNKLNIKFRKTIMGVYGCERQSFDKNLYTKSLNALNLY